MLHKFLITILIAVNCSAQNDSLIIQFDSWLIAGPIPIEMPAETGTGKFSSKDILNFAEAPVYEWYPMRGDKIKWSSSNIIEWKEVSGSELKLNSVDQTLPEITYLAVYIENDRWVKAVLEINTCHYLKAFIDGKEIISKTSTQAVKGDSACIPEKSLKEIELETGKHLLIVKALKDPKTNAGWDFSALVKVDTPFTKSSFVISTTPGNYATVEKLLEDPKIDAISISADGELAAVSVSEIPFGKDQKESWIDIYNTSDGNLFRSFKGGMNINSMSWVPEGKIFSYTTTDNGFSTLWIVDLEKGTSYSVLKDIKDFGNYYWAPDGSYLIYSIIEKPAEDKTGIKKIDAMNERLPGTANKNFLYKVMIEGGIKTRLTAGDKTLSLNSLSNDGTKALLSVSDYNLEKRPYYFATYYLLDLYSMRLDSLISLYWPGRSQFSPDGKKILFMGGPTLFGDMGINLNSDMIPNDYDVQAYIYEIESGNVDPITKYFNPSIRSSYWSRNEKAIYFNTIDKTFQHLYRYDLEKKIFKLINLDVEIVDEIDFANNTSAAVYKGSSATLPDRFCFVNLKAGKSKLLFDPAKESFEHVITGTTERWTFDNARGEEIDGLVYYPPNFDMNKKYPCIVFYYGGTTPVEQTFEGRYPRNVWAANGYVVYVLQPSGATGYGQQFSAYHVNDWGNTTAQEIIDGTKKFLASHPFVDPNRIGCIGASYGGFMTMNVLTKTDIFTAAISHAGISNLAGYWGVGYWGYTYSAIATANSFPWNRKDIYVNYSPIYNADKISTPLLLLHGSSDTNVPPGESTQMFTALKLLGKDVEYIQIADQDHHILEYNKRKQWTKTIIAYFDKYLKDQPQWWNSLYPEK